MNTTTGSLLILLVLLTAQFLLTMMYYAIANSRKKVLKEIIEAGREKAGHTLDLSENPGRLVATHQYLSMILAMAITATLVLGFEPDIRRILQDAGLSTAGADVLTLVILLPPAALLLVLFGHQLPTAVISGRAEGFAVISTNIMRLLVQIFAPVMRVTQAVSQTSGIILGGTGTTIHITEEEIKTLVDAGSEDGFIEDDEKDMIYSVFKFRDTLVREVMVPRIDIIGLDIKDGLQKGLDLINAEGHSRIPVYEESIDHIKGFLYAKDLLKFWREQDTSAIDIVALLREPYFVPETKKADDLLQEFQLRETHIAIVIDEYGGTAGLVTLEDLVEEIVGEIRDEYDFSEEAAYQEISETEYICSAGIDLDDLNELLDISLSTAENDTLGGYIFSKLGRVPEVGYTLVQGNIEMEVLTLKGRRRIDRVRVRKLPGGETENETEVTAAR